MKSIGIGDLARSTLMKSRVGSVKFQTVRLSGELASGKKSDIAAHLTGNLSGLAALEHARSLTGGFLSTARDLSQRAEAMQSVMGRISAALDEVSGTFSALGQNAGAEQFTRAAATASSAFGEALHLLNTQVSGRSIFAGMATSSPAVSDPEPILQTLRGLVSAAGSADQIATIVSDWFEAPTGFAAQGYVGAAPAPAISVDAEGTNISEVTAYDPDLRKALAALATAALIDAPGLSGAGPDRMGLRDKGLAVLREGTDAMTNLAAETGRRQQRLDQAISRHQTGALTLELAVADLTSADPTRTAIELEAAQTQLETMYAVTARLSRLTLAQVLG